jgi:ABC-type lipoprotein release transport system permease subunit
VLFGVSRLDPVGIGGAVALVIGIAFLASVVPARRGLGADPIATLRSE